MSSDKITNSSTVEQAKAHLRENWEEGVKCPCCTQEVKLYKYKINKGMALVLIQMYKSKNEWIHPIKDLKTINGDYAKLRFWGLVESSSDQPEDDKKANGFWRVTEKGKKFVNNTLRVKEKALLFNNKNYGFIGNDISITDALGNKFNYAELMNS